VSLADAAEFVDELVDGQVLVSDLGPDVTGGEAIHGLIARWLATPRRSRSPTGSSRYSASSAAAPGRGVGGNPTERYTAIQTNLDRLPARPNLPRLFQVDMVKPPTRLSLGPKVVRELTRGGRCCID